MKRRIIGILIVIILLAVLIVLSGTCRRTVNPLSGNVYFVDPATGSDSNNGLATNTCWAHVPGSVGFTGSGWPAHIVNGDKIVVKGGSVNNCQVWISSSSGDSTGYYTGSSAFDSMVIQSGHLYTPQWGTTRAIFDEQTTRYYALGLTSVNGITIDGFELRYINNCSTCNANLGSSGSACMLVSGPINYITIKDCWFHDAKRPASAGFDDQGHGIEGSQPYVLQFCVTANLFGPNLGTKSIEPYRWSSGTISNNFFLASGDHEMSVGSFCTNVDIVGNVVYLTYDQGTNIQMHQPTYGLTLVSAVQCDVWDNLIYAPLSRVGVSAFGMYEYTVSNRVVENTFALSGDVTGDGSATAFCLQKQIGDPINTNKSNIFMNNLFYKNSNQDGNIQFCIAHPSYVDSEKVTYNNFWGGVSTTENVMGYRVEGSSSADTVSPVSTYNPPTSNHTYANNLQVDPVLTLGTFPTNVDGNFHPATAYFSLSASSPTGVKNSGNPLLGGGGYGWNQATNKFAKDILGNTRTAWSIGAYETGSVLDPAITSQPSSQSVSVGSSATFNVTATGTATIHYYWTFNGTAVGTDSSSYTRSNCQLADNGGSVSVLVSNSVSSVTSSTATLTVTGGGSGGGGGSTNTISVYVTNMGVNLIRSAP